MQWAIANSQMTESSARFQILKLQSHKMARDKLHDKNTHSSKDFKSMQHNLKIRSAQ